MLAVRALAISKVLGQISIRSLGVPRPADRGSESIHRGRESLTCSSHTPAPPYLAHFARDEQQFIWMVVVSSANGMPGGVRRTHGAQLYSSISSCGHPAIPWALRMAARKYGVNF